MNGNFIINVHNRLFFLVSSYFFEKIFDLLIFFVFLRPLKKNAFF